MSCPCCGKSYPEDEVCADCCAETFQNMLDDYGMTEAEYNEYIKNRG